MSLSLPHVSEQRKVTRGPGALLERMGNAAQVASEAAGFTREP
jgi:hypothetical protein